MALTTHREVGGCCCWIEFADGFRGGAVQHFKENPYFSNTVLKKEYKYVPPPVDTGDKPDADGITDTMLEFSWERDVEPQVRGGGSRVAREQRLMLEA